MRQQRDAQFKQSLLKFRDLWLPSYIANDDIVCSDSISITSAQCDVDPFIIFRNDSRVEKYQSRHSKQRVNFSLNVSFPALVSWVFWLSLSLSGSLALSHSLSWRWRGWTDSYKHICLAANIWESSTSADQPVEKDQPKDPHFPCCLVVATSCLVAPSHSQSCSFFLLLLENRGTIFVTVHFVLSTLDLPHKDSNCASFFAHFGVFVLFVQSFRLMFSFLTLLHFFFLSFRLFVYKYNLLLDAPDSVDAKFFDVLIRKKFVLSLIMCICLSSLTKFKMYS